MDSLFEWMASAIGPIAKRLLSALGIGWLTFEGLGQLVDQAKDQVIAAWGGIGGNLLTLATIAGIGTAIGIILGAIVARVAYQSLAKLGKVML